MSIVINDTSPRVHYMATAGQTIFPVPFEFLDINDVFVYVNESLCTYNATPDIASEYNLTGVGTNDLKQVTFGSGLVSGSLVVIYRDIPIKSPSDFPTEGVFPVDELNEAMDSLTAMIQQTEVNVLSRSLTMDWADEPQALNPIPNLVARANKVLGFDANGQPIAVIAGTGSGTEADAATLNGQPGSYYLDRTNHTGQEEMTDIIGLPEALALKAPLQSPVFTGEPQSVTPPFGDNDTSIATSAFVQMSIGAKLDDAPADALTYGRRNGAWVDVPREAPTDDIIYGRRNKGWVEVGGSGGGGGGGSSTTFIGPLPPEVAVHGDTWWDSDSGGSYIYYNDGNTSQWVQTSAPSVFDTTQFVKQSQITGFLSETWGEWTPALQFGGAATGIAYGTRRGRYRRSGKLVMLWFDFTLSSKGSASGTATLDGIPFLPLITTPMSFAGTVGYVNNMTAGQAIMSCYMAGSTGLLTFAGTTGTGDPGFTSVTNTTFTNSSRIAGSISYEVA